MNTPNSSSSADQFRNQLAQITNPYRPPAAEDDELFARAMEEADQWHKKHNPAYASICEQSSRPLLPMQLLHNPAFCTPRVPGMPTDLARIDQAMAAILRHNGFFSDQPGNFLLLAPNPDKGHGSGYGDTFSRLARLCAPIKELHFIVDEDMRLHADEAWNRLAHWSKEESPVFIFGLSSFFEQLCLSGNKVLDIRGPLHGLTTGSCTSPDWSARRAGIMAGLEARLRGRHVQFRDLYGMREHPLHYISCSEGNVHLPLFSRFLLMDGNGTPAPKGQVGLVRLQNPFLDTLPAHDLLTEDFATWGNVCPCGDPLPFFRFMGRLNLGHGGEACACSCGS